MGDVRRSGITGPWQVIAGVIAGAGIGVVAALMGVAGGELLIPTIVLLYGIDIKVAGSLSLAVSLPTMLMAFARYSRVRHWHRHRRASPQRRAQPRPHPAARSPPGPVCRQGMEPRCRGILSTCRTGLSLTEFTSPHSHRPIDPAARRRHLQLALCHPV
ncbi:MAG: sulfite exporter TauE/SafE family protein [Nocardioides sp.]|nr:sulfite exporter TauE/SafE family protein [Nocardioides sp.]